MKDSKPTFMDFFFVGCAIGMMIFISLVVYGAFKAKAQSSGIGGAYFFQASNDVTGRHIQGRIFVDGGTAPAYGTGEPEHKVVGQFLRCSALGCDKAAGNAIPVQGLLREKIDHSFVLLFTIGASGESFRVELKEDFGGTYSTGKLMQIEPKGQLMHGEIVKTE